MHTKDIKRGFKAKTIEKTIRQKMTKWLKSIDNEVLRKKVAENYIVTGGAITSMLQGNLPNDYDVYLRSPEVAAELAKYYVSKLDASKNEKVSHVDVRVENGRVSVYVKSAGITGKTGATQETYEYFEYSQSSRIEDYIDTFSVKETGKFEPLMLTTNAITLSDKVQIVLRFTGDPAEIHKNYDFVHTTNYYTPQTGLVVNIDALMSTMAYELKYVGSLYPLCSMFRLKKFIQRGWTITAGEMLKIGWDISKLDLTDPVVLKEQLTGVDAAYFNELIRVIKSEERELDRVYLVELINRIFDEDHEPAEDDDSDSFE